ncbi:MAG: hypothetical protein K2W96_05765 [Gemmataceae bacterium]|nr:hypothetical protein [Gemmataceae bacterium]
MRTILELFDIDLETLTSVVADNPSLRGMLLGYIAERKLTDLLRADGRATAFRKDDDHDRTKKGDLVLTYKEHEFKIEVKSLQTNAIELLAPGSADWVRKMLKLSGPGQPNPAYAPIWEAHRLAGSYRGQFQCDASDKRTVSFPDGSTLETTNLLFGEFDILAAGLFAFREKWDFGFALNRRLPASTNTRYPEYQRRRLITSMIPVTWPLAEPFTTDVYSLLDILVAERVAGVAAPEVVPAPSAPVVETKPAVKVVERKRKKKP